MKRSTVVTGLLMSIMLTLVACGKKEDGDSNSIRRGNAKSDGISASTGNIILSGIPVALHITGITSIPGQGYSQFQNINQCNVYGGNQRIGFDLNVNGVPLKLEAEATIKSTTAGQFSVFHSMGCYDAYCRLAFVNVVATPAVNNYYTQQTGTEYAQLIAKYDFNQGKIVDVRENKGFDNTILRPCDITSAF